MFFQKKSLGNIETKPSVKGFCLTTHLLQADLLSERFSFLQYSLYLFIYLSPTVGCQRLPKRLGCAMCSGSCWTICHQNTIKTLNSATTDDFVDLIVKKSEHFLFTFFHDKIKWFNNKEVQYFSFYFSRVLLYLNHRMSNNPYRVNHR